MFARNSRTLTLMLLIAAGACSDSITGPQVGPAPEMLYSHTVGTLPASHTYDFNACTDLFAYEDLTVTVTPIPGATPIARCADADGDGDIEVEFASANVVIELGGEARSIEATLTGFSGGTVLGRVGESEDVTPVGFISPEFPSFTAPPGTVITGLGLFGFQNPFTGVNPTMDDLIVLYETLDGPGDPGDPEEPTTKDECKDGGWQSPEFEALGFKNQGQCVRFVETGKDPLA